MERVAKHIEVSAQAATDSVAALKDRTAKQMRAYVAVIIGNGVYQERREGMGDLKFQAKPEIKNTGHTPAKNLRIQIKAAILPVPLPNDFGFPLSPRTEGAAMLGAQQTAMLSAVVDEFVPDEEVAAIKEGAARALYVWGLITYDDIFGESHSTKFCQWLTWLPNRTVFGYYIPGYNDGD